MRANQALNYTCLLQMLASLQMEGFDLGLKNPQSHLTECNANQRMLCSQKDAKKKKKGPKDESGRCEIQWIEAM